MTYSIAIRTLGVSGFLRQELESVFAQTIKPSRVLIYIADGYKIPDFRVEDEEYIRVKKGMAAQRLLPYDEIDSDFILMLDDDVVLQPDSVEKLLDEMQINNADLISADTFETHKLSSTQKLYAAIANFVFPRRNQKWAFKIHPNGSFSYLDNPSKDFYFSQSCAGNVMLWRKISYLNLRFNDELWIDTLPFAYGDDMLESYKAYKNGMKLGVVYNSGIKHMDAKTASGSFRKSPEYIKKRTMAQLAVWWRTCFSTGNTGFFSKFLAAGSFLFKILWLFCGFLALSVVKFDGSYISNFIKGLWEGWKFIRYKDFRNLPPYIVNHN